MDERLCPRSFTGLTDAEWRQFGDVVKSFLGSGKRSMFIATIVKKVIENEQWQHEKTARLDQKAAHAMNDTMSFFGLRRMMNTGD